MSNKTMLVTGSSGLIGSEVVESLHKDFNYVYGIDNNLRASFFGAAGDTNWNKRRLEQKVSNFKSFTLDIRDREGVSQVIEKIKPDLIVHAAAQPSHDLAAKIPFDDFDINAVGTLNLLEAVRKNCPSTVFVHMSTNKVYGDAPNSIELKELPKRWDFADPKYKEGIAEDFTIDQSKHSLFGASKLAADILVQEYGRYFDMKTCCLRAGCLTGPRHSGVELHGFLSYLIKCNLEGRTYKIFGYKGKQVRDNIHSFDVAQFIKAFFESPRIAEVYNLGGGRENSISILEAFEKIEVFSGKKMHYDYVDKNREGDHICYISNLGKIKKHYPNWEVSKSLDAIFFEILSSLKSEEREINMK